MKYKAILFDLDGTLLPMDMEKFGRGYIGELCKIMVPMGVPKELVVKSMNDGIKAMVMNDGSTTNYNRFWTAFEQTTGRSRIEFDDICKAFYSGDFYNTKRFTDENPLADVAVKSARDAADLVILATNPLFPMEAQIARMSWVGLKPEDFDLVTSYEKDCYCKPNPAYYDSVLKRSGLKPEDCLMIGNDEREDMYAGTIAGIDCYLVRDCMLTDPEHPWTGPQGTFAEMVDMLRALK